jgi:hypothetical protein
MYSVDGANNTSPVSNVIRTDVKGADPFVEISGSGIIGPDTDISFHISDPFNIDPDSVEYMGEQDGVRGNWTPAGSVRVEISETVSPFDLPPGARSVTVTVVPEEGWVDPDISLRWRDDLPLGGYKTTSPFHFDIDHEAPDLTISSDKISLRNPVRIGIGSGEDNLLSDIAIIRVRIEDGNWTDLGSRGGPELIEDDTGSYLLVNVTWGEITNVSIMAGDPLGNTVIRTITVRATRPPDVSIMGVPEKEIGSGENIKLYADCSDPDGDHLSYRWVVDGEVTGEGSSLSLDPGPGDHEIILYASDGDLETNASIIITVAESSEENGGLSPLIIIIPLIILLAAAGIGLAVFLNVRRRGSPDEDDGEEESWGDDGSDDDRRTDKKIKCGLCMRAVTDSRRSVKCRCGERFHVKCAMKEGVCPECGREILIPAEI